MSTAEIASVEELEKFISQDDTSALETGVFAVLKTVADTGRFTPYSWASIRSLISIQLTNVMKEYTATSPEVPNVDGETFTDRYSRVKNFLATFTSAPFTLQRMAELLVEPKRYYRNTSKFFLAFSKLVCGISVNLYHPSSAPASAIFGQQEQLDSLSSSSSSSNAQTPASTGDAKRDLSELKTSTNINSSSSSNSVTGFPTTVHPKLLASTTMNIEPNTAETHAVMMQNEYCHPAFASMMTRAISMESSGAKDGHSAGSDKGDGKGSAHNTSGSGENTATSAHIDVNGQFADMEEDDDDCSDIFDDDSNDSNDDSKSLKNEGDNNNDSDNGNSCSSSENTRGTSSSSSSGNDDNDGENKK